MKHFEALCAVCEALSQYNDKHLQTINVQVYEYAQYIMYMLVSLRIITHRYNSAVDYEHLLRCVYDEIACVEMSVDCMITNAVMQHIMRDINTVID